MSGNVVRLRADTTDADLQALGFERDDLGGWRLAAGCEVLVELRPDGRFILDVVTADGRVSVESHNIDIERD